MRFAYALCLIFSCCLFSESAAAEDLRNNGKVSLDQSKDVLFEQFATNTFSLELLQAKNKFDTQTLVVGGVGEVDLQHWQGDNIITTPIQKYQVGTGAYFTQATLDLLANYTSWGSGFLSISDNHIGQGGPNGNYIYLPHAFLLFGDLNKFPVYLTFGINSIPFGNFVGSGVWNSPLTLDYFSPQPSPQISLAYYKNKWNLSATYYSDTVNHENHFVAAISYNNTLGNVTYGFGLGHINDLKANATGNPATVKQRHKFIPPADLGRVWDVNANIGYKLLSLTGEYLVGSHSVVSDSNKPKAFNLTLSFAPTLLKEVTTFGISHSVALNLRDIPTSLAGLDAVPLAVSGIKSNWSASVSRPIFTKNLILGLDAEKAVTFDKKQTFTYTLDLLAYL